MAETAAHMLVGRVLNEEWVVEEKLTPNDHRSRRFSVGYRVRHERTHRFGYLKALDLASAVESGGDMMLMLESMSKAFNYERLVCKKCTDKSLANVVHALSSGEYLVDDGNPFSKVPYLIFELAKGDVRQRLDIITGDSLIWKLRTLHNAAVGLTQLHGVGISHNNLHPANVLDFESQTKVADLGRSSSKHESAPHDEELIAGAQTLAPPELLYGDTPIHWDRHRLGCDLYHFGSLVVFMFSRTGFNALIANEIDPTQHWTVWAGHYSEVYNAIYDAYARALAQFKQDVPELIQDKIVDMVGHLCHPDPACRGHPDSRRGYQNPYSLHRFITQLDVIAKRVEISGAI